MLYQFILESYSLLNNVFYFWCYHTYKLISDVIKFDWRCLLPQVSVVNNVNSAVGPSSIVDKEHVLYGKAYITERLRGLVFEISANSFFQTNTEQVLASILLRFCSKASDEVSLDSSLLLAGWGTVSECRRAMCIKRRWQRSSFGPFLWYWYHWSQYGKQVRNHSSSVVGDGLFRSWNESTSCTST